jgi:hypothetical protein
MSTGETYYLDKEMILFGKPLSTIAKDQFAMQERKKLVHIGQDEDASLTKNLKKEEIRKIEQEKTRRHEAEKAYNETEWEICTTEEMKDISTDAATKFPVTKWGKFMVAGVMRNRRDSGNYLDIEHPVTEKEVISLMVRLNQCFEHHDVDDPVLSEEEISHGKRMQEDVDNGKKKKKKKKIERREDSDLSKEEHRKRKIDKKKRTRKCKT